MNWRAQFLKGHENTEIDGGGGGAYVHSSLTTKGG